MSDAINAVDAIAPDSASKAEKARIAYERQEHARSILADIHALRNKLISDFEVAYLAHLNADPEYPIGLDGIELVQETTGNKLRWYFQRRTADRLPPSRIHG